MACRNVGMDPYWLPESCSRDPQETEGLGHASWKSPYEQSSGGRSRTYLPMIVESAEAYGASTCEFPTSWRSF